MVKYCYCGEQTALVLPDDERTVLPKGKTVEIDTKVHTTMSKHPIVKALIEQGFLHVEGLKNLKSKDESTDR